MTHPLTGDERRRSIRRIPAPGEPIRRVRSRTGHQLDVIDVSDLGVLVECRTRLLPNTHMDIHIVARGGRVLIRCRVVRAYVCHVEADLVRYRVALAFNHPLETAAGYPLPAANPGEFRAVGIAYPESVLAGDDPSATAAVPNEYTVSRPGTRIGSGAVTDTPTH